MPQTKRKTTDPLSCGKVVKKRDKINNKSVPTLTDDDNNNETRKSGKNTIDKIEKEKGFMYCTNIYKTPDISSKNHDIKEAELPNQALNRILQQKSKINLQGSLRWKTFLFPPIPMSKSFPDTNQQYFGLDLVDEDKERTHWTHKASVWHDLFESVIEMAKTDPEQVASIDPAFHGILHCPVRASPNGPNETKMFKSARNQSIQHWIMLVPIPSEMNHPKYIAQFLSKFQVLYKKPFIQSAYKCGAEAITTHEGLLNQVSEKGYYWHVLDNATEKEIISQSLQCLSEVLMDFTIKEIIHNMFGVQKDTTNWPDAIKAYAFGNKRDII